MAYREILINDIKRDLNKWYNEGGKGALIAYQLIWYRGHRYFSTVPMLEITYNT